MLAAFTSPHLAPQVKVQPFSLNVVILKRRKSAERINSNDIKDYEEEADKIWTISAGNQDPKGRKLLSLLPFPSNIWGLYVADGTLYNRE